jgi:predicted unusual protein kinase regulating ubiquinone biosynthesis (AarF/ABC1/UbiB family)
MQERGVVEYEVTNGKISPVEFLVQLAINLKAFGVRSAQLIDTVVVIPEEYRGALSNVYDNIRGQIKTSAIRTVVNEYPQFWDNISEVGDRLGGGSIATVYDLGDNVLKVRNPNLDLFMRDAYAYLSKVVEGLIAEHGEKYRSLESLINMVREWITLDSSFLGVHQKDTYFRETHHGYQAEGSDYQIYVPKAQEIGSDGFLIEEKVAGIPLTNWEKLVASGHDVRSIVKTLVTSYIYQIMTGLAMSDVHIGNFAVTPDKRIATYDRTMFLEFSEAERQMLFSTVNPSIDVDVAKGMWQEYLGISNISDTEVFVQFVESIRSYDGRLINDALIQLRRQNIDVPLKYLLLFKNLAALTDMAKKSGYSSIGEIINE